MATLSETTTEKPTVIGEIRLVTNAIQDGTFIKVTDSLGIEHYSVYAGFINIEELMAHPENFETVYDGAEFDFPGLSWNVRKKTVA